MRNEKAFSILVMKRAHYNAFLKGVITRSRKAIATRSKKALHRFHKNIYIIYNIGDEHEVQTFISYTCQQGCTDERGDITNKRISAKRVGGGGSDAYVS